MPYIPDLIPDESKIIPEYFTKQAQAIKPKSAPNTGQTLLGLLFLAVAVYFTRCIGFTEIFGVLAVFCTRASKRWLENVGRYSLTGIARLVSYLIIIAISIPVYHGYQHRAELAAAEQ
jgi:hypothetical protein